MTAVARTKPAMVIACIGDRDAAQMGAYAQNDKPLRLLHALKVCFWMAKLLIVVQLCKGNLLVGAMSNKHRLSAPLDRSRFAQRDGSKVNFDRAFREDVRGGRHSVDKFENKDADGGGSDEFGGAEDHVGEGALGRVATHVAVRMVVVVIDVADGKSGWPARGF